MLAAVRHCLPAAMAVLLAVALAANVASAATTPCPFTWNTNLKVGSSGNDVLYLQQFLNADTATMIASSGVGSPGNESTFFGAKTKAAVVKFQEKYFNEILGPNGLSKGTGTVGVSTRATLNALCGGIHVSASSPIPSSSSSLAQAAAAASAVPALTVSAADQPPPTLAVQSALYVPFTRFTLTAGAEDVTVNSVTVERTGPSKNSAFDDLDILGDDGSVISTAYLHADSRTTFMDSFVIPAGTSQTFTIVGDMNADLSDDAGEVAVIQINAIDASVPVSGTLPIRGTPQSMNATLPIGSASATLSYLDPNVASTRYVNETGVRFSSINITAGSTEDLYLGSITWRQNGTANASDISNVSVVIQGVSYPAEADDRYYTAVFPGDGILIPKGNSVDAYIQGDIGITGSYRTVQFDINFATDVYLVGTSYGYGIYLVPGGNTATSGNSVFLTDTGDTDGTSLQPFFVGSPVTISGGAVNYVGR